MPAGSIFTLRDGFRRAVGLLAAAVMSMSTVYFPVAPAASAAAPVPAALGEAAAGAAAVASGRRVEATALRTERQQVFANPDGTFTLEQTVLPTRVRRGAGW